MSKISLKNISVIFKQYPGKPKHSIIKMLLGLKGKGVDFKALNNITVDINDGDRIALIGKNGSGKSTLLKVMADILPPDKGSIKVNGNILTVLDIKSGIIANASCNQNIILKGLSIGYKGQKLTKYIKEVTERADLEKFINSPYSTLSDGMKSRLVVAMISAIEYDILLIDEWIGATDKSSSQYNKSTLHNMINRCNIFIMASHSEAIIRSICNRALIVDQGQIVYDGDIDSAYKYFNEVVLEETIDTDTD